MRFVRYAVMGLGFVVLFAGASTAAVILPLRDAGTPTVAAVVPSSGASPTDSTVGSSTPTPDSTSENRNLASRAVNLAHTPTCVPEQVIKIEDGVYAYSVGSSCANFCEDNRGSISPGKYSNPVVLSQDIYHVDRDQITNTNIDLTVVDGEIAYSR
jgi:predicted amidohydrolase YtcJ